MNVSETIKSFSLHMRSSLKPITIKNYEFILRKFEAVFGERLLLSISSDEIGAFLEDLTASFCKSTRRLRYAQMKTFFNFAIDHFNLEMKNPCSTQYLSKAFKIPGQRARKILDKELVDEMIYSAKSLRDRLIFELQARCGLRVGELLKLRASDVSDRKLLIREPKSGKDLEVAYMPEQISNRINDYMNQEKFSPDQRLFPVCYSTIRLLIKGFANKSNLKIAPHDLRRHSATYASRNGVPLEIVSKIILRHQDLKTTQIYLGKVSESEAIRWMDILHGK